MFGYKFIIAKVWSNNILLPKASIVKDNLGTSLYYPSLPTNQLKKFTYRLKPMVVGKNKIAR